MSGSRSNIVPMPMPMPQGMSMPGQMMSSYPAGCCPPGDMSALLQCYCDIQAATAFISKVVTDLAANDPAFQKALVDGIAASGSNLPLIGVTNGSDAQPGQVGEFIDLSQTVNYPVTANTNQVVTMGILQPGDWDVWAWADCPGLVTGLNIDLNPIPPGFSSGMQAFTIGIQSASPQAALITTPTVRATLSVPTLCVMNVLTNQVTAGPAPGTIGLVLSARRRR